ncbi:MAG TPA: hypothetical protein VGT00_03565, partial [Methylomirabilota bacterium]|nr:hypothetical protein [Methylomirabilota bacterium]
ARSPSSCRVIGGRTPPHHQTALLVRGARLFRQSIVVVNVRFTSRPDHRPRDRRGRLRLDGRPRRG